MSKVAISQVKGTLTKLKSAAKSAGTMLAELSGGEFEPGENVVAEVPLIAHQLQRYVDHYEEQQKYADKDPEQIAEIREQEKQDAIAKMQEAAAEQLNARVQIPEPEAEPEDAEPGQTDGDSNENPDDQPENPEDQTQGESQPPVV